jgi:hypothetical protein
MDIGNGKYFPIHPSLLFGRMAELAKKDDSAPTPVGGLRVGEETAPVAETWEDVFPLFVSSTDYPFGEFDM